jgi:hypothetical protein
VLLIVMYEAGTWRAQPGQTVTFGRGQECTIKLPAGDRGLSRSAGSLSFHDGAWWLGNDSSSSMLYLSGDRGFRVDLPPGMQIPVQQWHAKVRLQGVFDSYTLMLRLPDLDDLPGHDEQPGQASPEPVSSSERGKSEALVTSTRYHAPLTHSDRLVLAARFEQYLRWRHRGAAAPRSAKDTARTDRLATTHGSQAVREHPRPVLPPRRSRLTGTPGSGSTCRAADLYRRAGRERPAALAKPSTPSLNASIASLIAASSSGSRHVTDKTR